MEIYIDLIYLINSVLGCLCLLCLSILVSKIISIRKCIILSLLWGLHVLTLYSDEYLYIVWVIIVSYFFDRKNVIKNTLILLFVHETFLNSFTGIYRIGNVLVIGKGFDWLASLFVGMVILLIYIGVWFQIKQDALYTQLVYEVLIKINQKTQSLKGFLDTGNQALYEGLPVIFLKTKLNEYDAYSSVNEINGEKRYAVKKGEIYFKNQWYPCVFSYRSQLDIKEDCLLNYYLM